MALGGSGPLDSNDNIFETYKGCIFHQHVQNHTSWWFQIFFIFTPIPGEMIQFDEHIFQVGWFNHQLAILFRGELFNFGRGSFLQGRFGPTFAAAEALSIRLWCFV